MALVDAALFQNWKRAFDNHDRIERQWQAAGATNNQALIDHLAAEKNIAGQELNAALRELNTQT